MTGLQALVYHLGEYNPLYIPSKSYVWEGLDPDGVMWSVTPLGMVILTAKES